MTNRVQDLLGIEIPIVQAPMTFIANAALAVAVSEAGGMGVVETLSPQGREDLARLRDLTSKPVGANLMIQGWKSDPSIVETIAASGVKYVATSAGDPALFTAALQDAGLTVFHVVGSLRAAQKAIDAGVDGLVVEGVEGGGFKGALGASTMVLLPLIAAALLVPRLYLAVVNVVERNVTTPPPSLPADFPDCREQGVAHLSTCRPGSTNSSRNRFDIRKD